MTSQRTSAVVPHWSWPSSAALVEGPRILWRTHILYSTTALNGIVPVLRAHKDIRSPLVFYFYFAYQA